MDRNGHEDIAVVEGGVKEGSPKMEECGTPNDLHRSSQSNSGLTVPRLQKHRRTPHGFQSAVHSSYATCVRVPAEPNVLESAD